MSTTLDLLPCPFCGGEPEVVEIEDGENAGGSCVSCKSCMASSNVEFEFKENFVSNWNRRAKASRSTDDLRANIDGTGHVVISAPPKVEGEQGDENLSIYESPEGKMDITQALMGPHEWGYRDPVEGGWIEDQTPFAAAELISALRLECAKLRRIMSTPTGDA